MSALERVAALFHLARLNGGWNDEDVAADVLKMLKLNEDGHPLPADEAPTSSNLGHG